MRDLTELLEADWAIPHLTHSTAGIVIDRFNRLISKFDGAAKLVKVFLLRNRRGMAARAPAVHHTAFRDEWVVQKNMRTLETKVDR